MHHSSKGFTLIELLMVIIIVGTLGTTAIGTYLDFRNEAKVAALLQTLRTLRTAFKNQEMQARLRCNVSSTEVVTYTGYSYSRMYLGLAWNSNSNDITFFPTGDPRHLCTTAQISNPVDRRFWDGVSGTEEGRFFVAGIDVGGSGYPENILVAPTASTSPCNIWGDDFLSRYSITDRCAAADRILSFGYACNWLYDFRTGELWPATRTAGINECYF